MKKFFNWLFNESNRQEHIRLLALLTLILCAVLAFFTSSLIALDAQVALAAMLVAVTIEAYQIIVARKVDWSNTLGDLLADVFAIGIGLVVYDLLALLSPWSAIVMYVIATALIIVGTVKPKIKAPCYLGFLLVGLVAFSLFVFAK